MPETTTKGLLVINNERVFIPSQNINIFPCSRRGRFNIDTLDGDGKPSKSLVNGDPEARLNTERTNRLRTAINGFTDSFIVNNTFTSDDTLVFVLAGYRIEVKKFTPADVAAALGKNKANTECTIYAHLSLHDDIPLGVSGYFTEILYRQLSEASTNYLDVEYTDSTSTEPLYFFRGVSFVVTEDIQDVITNTANGEERTLVSANLPLFNISYDTDTNSIASLVESSKLPKVEHDTAPNSIKLSGDFAVEHPILDENGNPVLNGEGKPEIKTSFKVTDKETLLGPTVMSSLIVGTKADDEGFVEGTIKAKNRVETPTLEATESITTPQLTVTDQLSVQNEGNGKILADTATITDLKITNEIDASKITANEIWLDKPDGTNIGQVPALEIAKFTGTEVYQLRFRFTTSPVIEVNPPSSDEIEPTVLVLKETSGNTLLDNAYLTLTVPG